MLESVGVARANTRYSVGLVRFTNVLGMAGSSFKVWSLRTEKTDSTVRLCDLQVENTPI